jgi:hypothetical protein
MTVLVLLRALNDRGIGLSAVADQLDVNGAPDVLTPEVLAAIARHKAALLRLLDPTALRAHFHVPADHAAISPTFAVVLLRLATERKAFTEAERALYDRRVIERRQTEARHVAELFAIDDIIHGRVACAGSEAAA